VGEVKPGTNLSGLLLLPQQLLLLGLMLPLLMQSCFVVAQELPAFSQLFCGVGRSRY